MHSLYIPEQSWVTNSDLIVKEGIFFRQPEGWLIWWAIFQARKTITPLHIPVFLPERTDTIIQVDLELKGFTLKHHCEYK